ncbi:MAG TPA: glycerol-3-phosphate dehydrogenase/oxidase [Cyclobacteriaceae bacterium]|nr:glycerol-3-phosphate dehydrogenase/oxidase [Cyclobacteriaceae bacterium]
MASHGFSVTFRDQLLERLRNERFDLLVIGGGITGAGIALDAVSRGLKVALVERDDFAYGTSSRSTKLIHGGLRYLKQLEFGLVKEVGSERAVVHNLAPHLVVPEKMLLPLSEGKSLGYLLTSFGLKLYDWLANVKKSDQRRMLTRPQTLRYEPLLKKDFIKGGAIYAEYRTDDARLTLEVMKTAFQMGAICVSYLAARDFLYEDKHITGARVVDVLTQQEIELHATAIVNATGPWVDDLRTADASLSGKHLHLTKGVHIVVPRERLPVKQAIYFDVNDGRMIFAIPRGRVSYIGTTDTNYRGDKDHVAATVEDAEYLIQAVNDTFPSVQLSLNDIESSWAGLRPLIHEEGKSASELSRRDEIFESSSGLISIAGGKLTGYRKMAERVVDLVIHRYFGEQVLRECATDRIGLAGNTFTGYQDVVEYREEVARQLSGAGLDGRVAEYLVENYGQQTNLILRNFLQQDASLDKDLALILSELWFCFHHEMIVTLADFFNRRTGLLNFDIVRVKRWKNEVATELGRYAGWSDERKQSEIDALDTLIAEARLNHTQ